MGTPEAVRARQTVDAQWNPVAAPPIDGLKFVDVKNHVYRGGVLTELYRPEWFEEGFPCEHVVMVGMLPGYTSKWHCHRVQRDIVFPVRGTIRMGFYDGREQSPTRGKGCVQDFDLLRPRYAVIPPGVWHALRNLTTSEAAYVVLNDVAFDYAEPDDWAPADGNAAIPVSLD